MRALFSFFSRLFFPRFSILPPHLHAATPLVIPGNIGRRLKRTQVYSDYTAKATDEYIVAVASLRVTLPAASAVPEGWCVFVANPVPGSYTVLASPAGTDTLLGVSSEIGVGVTTSSLMMFVSDGVDNWECTASGITPT